MRTSSTEALRSVQTASRAAASLVTADRGATVRGVGAHVAASRGAGAQAATGAHAFETAHPSVPLACFGAIVALTMLAPHPVYAAMSLACALAFSVSVRGMRHTLAALRWQLPLLALVCLANPLFSASGSTLVIRIGTRAVYLESLAYGACMGAMLVASLLWFEGAAAVLSQDRILGLAGTRARTLPLLASMASALVPQLVRRGRRVTDVRAACTAAGPKPGPRASAVRTSTILLSWALEDSLERADAMRARGWESGCVRTVYRPCRLTSGDLRLLGALALLAAISGLLAWVACSQWRFYPSMPRLVAWWGYLPALALMLWPTLSELRGRALERRGV